MPLMSFVGRYAEMPADLREAYLDLVIDRFLELPYPTPADFGRRYGVAPGGAAFAARWAAVRAEARRINVDGAVGAATVALLVARSPSGEPLMLAAQQIVRGAGKRPLGATIGCAASTLPTHRMLTGFAYPPGLGIAPEVITEGQAGEFVRLVVADRARVLPLVDRGVLTGGEARALLRDGMYAVMAAAFRHDQAIAPPARAYLTNTRGRLVRAVARRGLHWHGLHAHGAEPVSRLRRPGNFNFPYWDWERALRGEVPASTLARGVAAAVAHLSREDPERLARLPLSLPFALPCDGATRVTFARWHDRFFAPLAGTAIAASLSTVP